ncbi:MAG: cation transporter [Chloroflexi bacterium]|jgi:cation diffusion facilitator family transporter|nr:cation transporter [Chloroflexota bacterium]MDL1915585.1 cation transporter [Anaerolineae bacterium CFX4]OQY81208.1 MAG: cation-efflux pump [Anaerolineae bacterium UTCFX5]GIK28406.1 MAG: transporter [Chloroflexota bacterium]
MRGTLHRYAYLSIGAAVVTIALKGLAYLLTGSVGLLSDAVESLVNLAAALVALTALIIAARPPDESHEYGHDKIEYFSSGIEGTLILVAGVSIIATSIDRLLRPHAVEQIGIGLGLSVLASLVNFGVAMVLDRVGRANDSVTLQADAHHLMTDVWTSVGVLTGLIVVGISGVTWLDPVIALVVALNILRIGIVLLRKSVDGLMDTPIPEPERRTVEGVIHKFETSGIQFHALRTRQSGARRFISVHVLVPPRWTVKQAHDVVEDIEREMRAVVPHSRVFTHLEPQGDPAAFDDLGLDRPE